MKIGELSKRANVSRDTIRLYERHGLLHSDVNTANNYRIYPEDALLTLEIIRDAQSAGLSIAEITIFISQLLSHGPQDADIERFLDEKIQEVTERVTASTRFLEMLRQTQAALKSAPQDGLNEVRKAGAGNGNRTRN